MTCTRVSLAIVGLLSASILLAPAASPQDPGTQAAMQASQAAMDAAQQANQAMMQAAQQANLDAIRANEMAMNSANPWCCGLPFAASPHFSKKSGAYNKPITVRLTDRAWGAVIHYTTDGWTPTAASPRYAGPIAVSSTTRLQAVAFAPRCSASLVASAVYTFPAAAPPAPLVLRALPEGNGLYRIALDTPVPLVFTAPVSSQTAQVGDRVSLQLAEDLKAGDTLLAPKGTSATGRVVQVDRPATDGLPGVISFEVDSLTLHGLSIPLHAAETLAGKPEIHKAIGLAIIPGVGLASLLVRGQNAQIVPGTRVMATLSAGTILPPQS